MPRKTPRERFEKFVEKSNACWIWKGSKTNFGHGQIYINGRKIGSHRFSWMLFKGEIPDGKWVLHKCDVPCCVNPDHLFLGNHQDNIDDMVKKNRHKGISRPGALNPRAKLTELEIEEIKKLYKPRNKEFGQKALAKRFGISQGQVSNILTEKVWKKTLNSS